MENGYKKDEISVCSQKLVSVKNDVGFSNQNILLVVFQNSFSSYLKQITKFNVLRNFSQYSLQITKCFY